MQKLEEAVRVLERRVASLEDQLYERKAPAPVASGKENWRKLRRGMSEGEVEQLLGSPSTINEYGSFSVWHYGTGKVTFRGGRRTVDGWDEP